MNLCKKEQLDILKLLLAIENTNCRLFETEMVPTDDFSLMYVDLERYLAIAIRLDPNDGEILSRK